MIIHCQKCGARFKFDESMIQGEGVWVRCGRCRDVFFQENLFAAGREQTKEGPVPPAEPQAVEDLSGESAGGFRAEAEKGKKGGRSLKKIAAYAVLLLLISGGLIIGFVPGAGNGLLEVLPGGAFIAEYFGIEASMPAGGRIDFIDVRDTFIKNWLAGDLMVISGTAVNRNSFPVSKLQVKARLLDSTGRFIAEAKSFGGNVPSNEDLAKWTDKEIAQKLSTGTGSDISNANIAPGGRIPFIVVFTNPPKSAVEFIVETASVERSKVR